MTGAQSLPERRHLETPAFSVCYRRATDDTGLWTCTWRKVITEDPAEDRASETRGKMSDADQISFIEWLLIPKSFLKSFTVPLNPITLVLLHNKKVFVTRRYKYIYKVSVSEPSGVSSVSARSDTGWRDARGVEGLHREMEGVWTHPQSPETTSEESGHTHRVLRPRLRSLDTPTESWDQVWGVWTHPQSPETTSEESGHTHRVLRPRLRSLDTPTESWDQVWGVWTHPPSPETTSKESGHTHRVLRPRLRSLDTPTESWDQVWGVWTHPQSPETTSEESGHTPPSPETRSEESGHTHRVLRPGLWRENSWVDSEGLRRSQ